MYSFKSLYVRLFIILLVAYILWVIADYLLAPFLGIKITTGHTLLFVGIAALIAFCAGFLLYLTIKKLNKTINTETAKKNETIERYDALSAATHDAIWDTDLRTGYTFYNNHLRTLFGYTNEELRDNTSWWEENIHPEEKEKIVGRINNILTNPEIILWSDEYRFRCKDGSYKDIFDRSFIVRNEKGEAIRIIGAMIDVSEVKALQQQLIQEQLEHKNKMGQAIIHAHETERKKIREELHEDVNQVLASVKLFMHQIARQKVSEDSMLNQSLHYLDDAMQKVRKLSKTLAPISFETFGLVSSIEDFISDIENNNPVNINFKIENFDESKTDDDLRLLIYRIIEEQVNKLVVSPEPPEEIFIELQNGEEKKVRLLIYEQIKQQTGLQHISQNDLTNIQSKLEMYKGRMHIIQKDGVGSVLEIVL
jgi:two-component system, NarL family, sensor histidine kinase UhpB